MTGSRGRNKRSSPCWALTFYPESKILPSNILADFLSLPNNHRPLLALWEWEGTTRKVDVWNVSSWLALTPVMTIFQGWALCHAKQKCDSVSKERGGHSQQTISEQMFSFKRKETIFQFLNIYALNSFDFFEFDSSCFVLTFFFLTCLVMCSVDFYFVPILLEFHVLANFRERSSQLPSTIKAE